MDFLYVARVAQSCPAGARISPREDRKEILSFLSFHKIAVMKKFQATQAESLRTLGKSYRQYRSTHGFR